MMMKFPQGMAGVLLILCVPSTLIANELKPFTTDGCSYFPDGTPEQQSLWVNCCIRHDLAYWKGGSYQERVEADHALAQCVARVGQPRVAKIMLAGVRVGGSPYFPTRYRWGYGWPYPRGYQPLNNGERLDVQDRLEMLRVMLQGLSDGLNEALNNRQDAE